MGVFAVGDWGTTNVSVYRADFKTRGGYACSRALKWNSTLFRLNSDKAGYKRNCELLFEMPLS